MSMMLKGVLILLVACSTISCKDLQITPYAIDTNNGDLVNRLGDKIPYSEAKSFVCLEINEFSKLVKRARKCKRRK